jgi:hypothetical protein
VVTVRKIFSYDIVAAPGFGDAKMIDIKELERIRKEKLRKERLEKLKEINNKVNK